MHSVQFTVFFCFRGVAERFQSFDGLICFSFSSISKDVGSTSLRNSGDDLPDSTSHEG